MTELLAKSNPPETLVEHTENCLAVYFSMRENDAVSCRDFR